MHVQNLVDGLHHEAIAGAEPLIRRFEAELVDQPSGFGGWLQWTTRGRDGPKRVRKVQWSHPTLERRRKGVRQKDFLPTLQRPNRER